MASSSVVGAVDDIVLNVDFHRRLEVPSLFASEVQVVPGNIAWEDLELMLKIFSGHQSVRVSYYDDDNDPVVIDSEEELQESFNVARKCNNTLRLKVMCEDEACGLFDLEREPPVAPHNDSPLLEMSPGKVLYTPGLQSPEMLMPRGVNSDSRLECDGESEERKTAGDSAGKRSFFVINKRCPRMVLDVEGGCVQPGTSVIVWHRKTAAQGILNQLWYEDCRTATIRTRLNDFCLDVVDGRVVVNPCDLNSIGQKWTIFGNRIQNIFNQKWVIGLKKKDIHACDQVLCLAEGELTNTEWIIDDYESEVARKCNNTLRLTMMCENKACGLFDLEREPPVAPHNDSPLLEMSPGKVLYTRGLQSHEMLMPRGVNIDSRLDCDGKTEEVKTAGDSAGKRSFFVFNKHCHGMVLDVEGGWAQPGTSVIVWPKREGTEASLNQLWYEDCRTATIRTCLNDFCLDVVDGRLVINPCDLNSIGQKWTISGHRIQNVFNQKWVIGLKKRILSVHDQVFAMAEDELANTEWVTVDYRKSYCLDFDLCAYCESKEGVHDPTHLLLKMQVPQDQIQLKLSALEPVLRRNASGLAVAAPGQQIIELRMPEKNAGNEEQRVLQIVNHAEEIVQKNPQLKEPVDEENLRAVVSHSKSDNLSMNEDLLDAKLNQLKMNSSALTVPSNTPLVDTPPQTPPMVLELDEKQAEGRGVNEVPSSCEESPNHVNMAIMADLVHKKMSDIVTDGEYEYLDVERASNSSGSTSDFYVVPIPDCFNPRLPARKEASTSVIVKKSAVLRSCSLRSVDDLLSTSNCLATEALLSPKSCFSVVSSISSDAKNDAPVPKHLQQDEAFFEMDEIKASDIRQNIGASVLESIKRTEVEISEEAAVGELEVWQTETVDNIGRDAGAADSGGNSDMNEIMHENEANQLQLNEEQQMQRQQEAQQEQEVASRENRAEADASSAQNGASAASGGVEASTIRLMSSVFSFVAKTAKEVYSTLHDKNSYLPAPSNWTPTVNQWTPATSAWTPQPSAAWSPTTTPQWNPEPIPDDAPFCPAAETRSPMDQLIEMGFADRQLNQQLLQSHGNNIEMVIQKLVEMNGNIR